MSIRRRFALASFSVLVALLVAGFMASGANAATIGVSTTVDETTVNGSCSLREAISTVNDPAGLGNGDCTPATTGGANTIMLAAVTYKFANGGAGEDANASGDLDIAGTTTSLTISGAGASQTFIDANHVDRVFDIHSGPSVTFQGVTIENGTAPNGTGAGGSGTSGGGILSATALTVIDSVVTGNKAGNGNSGTSNPGGPGGTGGTGGGISSTAPVTLTNSTFSGNFAGNGGNGGTGSPSNATGGTGGGGASGGQGGGVFITSTTLTITGTAFSGNHAGNGGNGGKGGLGTNGTGIGGNGGTGGSGAAGGGVVAQGSSTVQISRSTFTGNIAGNGGNGGPGDDGTGGNGGNGGDGNSGGGGGAIGAIGTLTITNSTLQGNATGNGGTGGSGGNGNGAGEGGHGGNGAIGSQGGGLIALLTSPGALTNVTLSNNSIGPAGSAGLGGVGNSGTAAGGTAGSAGSFDHIRILTVNGVTLSNSIVTGGTGAPCSGVTDGGHNVVTDNCAGIASIGDPKLGALADNGGPTKTMALLSGSAAIDVVPASGAGCPTTDQRGAQRPGGSACDAGAYEVAPPVPVTAPADGIGDTGATLHGTVTPNSTDASVRFEFGTTTAYGTQTDVQHLSGFSGQAVTATISGLAPGTTYHYRVIGTNGDGSANGDDQTFTTTGTPPGGGGSNNPPPPGGSQTSLADLTKFALAPSTFRAAPKGPPATAAKARVGSTVSFTLNVAASVRFTVQKQLPGRRGRGGRCVKPTRANRKARKCTRLIAVRGSFTRTGAAGANSFKFTGRMGGRKLAPGRYRLVALPTAGGKAGKKKSAPFRIVK